MAETNKNKAPTHTAFALKREGRRQQFRKWLEIGVGWQRDDGSFQAHIDRTPLGGWTGFVHFQPAGKGEPLLPPERPGADERDESTEPGEPHETA